MANKNGGKRSYRTFNLEYKICLGKQVLGDGVEIIEFPDMWHGWTVRGDLADHAIERDVKKAFNLVLAFFGKYL